MGYTATARADRPTMRKCPASPPRWASMARVAAAAWSKPPTPMAAAPIARGPTSGAIAAAVPVVPHNRAAARTHALPDAVECFIGVGRR
jgi:hypothetical protein